MGKCKYCNQSAGFFSSFHKECENKHVKGKEDSVDLLSSCIVSGGDFTALHKQLDPILRDSFIMDIEYCFTSIFVAAYDRAVNQFLEDAGLSEEEEGRLMAFQNHYGFSQEMLDENGSLQKAAKAVILREIANGVLPKKMEISGSLPVILQKSETVIWAFTNVQYFERKTKTVYHGKTNGLSVRVAKGVYYRTSAFKGNPIQVEELRYVDSGLLIFTNKHVYFSSVMKNFKTPYRDILSVNPYEDGVDFQRHDMKPQVFKGIDGWFTYNLISNMAAFEESSQTS